MSIHQQVEIGGMTDACAVCGMPLDGVPVTKTQYRASDFIVCSPECAKLFYEDPERYIPADEPDEE